jgi:putative redox protein
MTLMTLKAHSNLRMEMHHTPSGEVIQTDVPMSSGGRGEYFSPTDMIGAALLSCIVTTMGIVANRLGVDLSGTTGAVEKIYRTDKPHLIAALKVTVNVPLSLDDDIKGKLERAAGNCPVYHALASDIQKEITINWTG